MSKLLLQIDYDFDFPCEDNSVFDFRCCETGLPGMMTSFESHNRLGMRASN